MNSRVHPKYKTKYRVTNWAEYDKALVKRGDITLWISEDAIDSWASKPSGKRGAPRKYSDLAIETAITLRLIYGLPLRQAEGFVHSLLRIMGLGLDAPDHTMLSRRSRQLDVVLKPKVSSGPIDLIIDSTGLSIVGQGERAAAKHGKRGKRRWKKLQWIGIPSGQFRSMKEARHESRSGFHAWFNGPFQPAPIKKDIAPGHQ